MKPVDAALLRQWMVRTDAPADAPTGRVLIIGGSRHTPGAVRLSAEAAMRAGAETVQILTVGSTAPSFAVAVPELLVTGVDETTDGEIAPSALLRAVEMGHQADVVLIGPGFMSPRGAVDLCRHLLRRLDKQRLVLDALSLAVLAAEPAFRFAAEQAVLTPNASEVGLALDIDPDDLQSEPDGGALRLARRSNAVVSSGGATSYIASPDGQTWRDDAGRSGLAASGSGDVKAGVVAAGLARFAEPARAAVWGGHVHALAGELAAARIGPLGYLASDVVAAIPAVLAALADSHQSAPDRASEALARSGGRSG